MNEQLKLGNLRLAVENDDSTLLSSLLKEEEIDVNYTFSWVLFQKSRKTRNNSSRNCLSRAAVGVCWEGEGDNVGKKLGTSGGQKKRGM